MTLRTVQLFSTVFLLLFLLSCNQSTTTTSDTNIDTNDIYAGVEIGSSGVKYHIIEMNPTSPHKKYETIDKRRLLEAQMQDENNEILASMMQKVIDEIIKVEESRFAEFGISQKDIFIVCSSSISKAPNILEFKQKLQAAFPYTELDIINPRTEAIAAMLTSNIPMDFNEIIFIDIGGGNSKIAVYDDKFQIFVTEEIPFGTRSLLNSIQKDELPSYEKIEKEGNKIVGEKIDNIIDNQPTWKDKETAILVGGVVYSLSKTLDLYVNDNGLARINITTAQNDNDDLEKFKDLVTKRRFIKGAKYNHEQFFCGQLILSEIISRLNTVNYYFADQQDWIPGYIIYEKQYK